MYVHGILSADRGLWMVDAQRFQQHRYTDPFSTVPVKKERMHGLMSTAIYERMDGIGIETPSVWPFLQALARVGRAKATPYGSPPAELFRNLSFTTKSKLIMGLRSYFADLTRPRPECWGRPQYMGLPKDGGHTDFAGIRWIGKSAAAHQWFLRSLLMVMERQTKPTSVVTIGFRKEAMVDDVVGIIVEILHFFHNWGSKIQVWISSLDVQEGFRTHETPPNRQRHDRQMYSSPAGSSLLD